jgi:L-alanine-DL-glutamate epimerase-like enolase superfamily enzyme
MSLDQLWEPGRGARAGSPIGRADHALFDLVGKALGVPSWSLIGSGGPALVPVYDGSIYFNDLLPEHAAQGVKRLLDEVDMGLERGHRAFKIKVGRGHKWMAPEDGFRRDVEVVLAIRAHVGPDVRLMADANNGLTPEVARRWLDAVADAKLFFIEEPFPETVADSRAFKDFLRHQGQGTLLADGESASAVEHFDPYLKALAFDVVQPDIRAFGLTLQWEQARRIETEAPGVKLAPHNWGSILGLPMQLMLGRALGSFLMAEIDTATSDLFDLEPYRVRDGAVAVGSEPGNGLVVRDDVLRSKYLPSGWRVGAA